MGELIEVATALLQKLQKSHEESEVLIVRLKHLLKRVADGQIVISEEKRIECVRTLQKTKLTVHDISKCFHTLTELTEDGCETLKTQESNPLKEHTCSNLKLNFHEDDLLQVRAPPARVSTDSAIGSVGSCSIADPDEFGAPVSTPRSSEHVDTTTLEEELNNLSKDSPNQEPILPDFQNLNVASLQTCSLNNEQTWDPKFGPVADHHPQERDSIAFANSIQKEEKSLIDAQGRAAHGLKRQPHKKDNTLVMQDDYFNDKDYDA